MASLKLPVIDLSLKNINPTSNSWITKCDEVTGALEEHGCFIAMYDGVSQELEDRIFLASQELFNPPTEVKVLNPSDTDTPYNGYIGQIPAMPLYESLGIENATTTEGAEKFTKHMWPSGNESFCVMTILHQRQIEVDPLPSSFIVMAGNACMAWTNGQIEAPYHKVIMVGNQERISLGLFTFIKDLKIEIPQKLIDEDNIQRFKEFDHYKYIDYNRNTNEGKTSKCPIKSYCGI
ncbi:hypothetical protein L2E82_52172 [Cichorium intybus]|nr:hypothetical protein L2E82_52172 [Cichorium intybus]